MKLKKVVLGCALAVCAAVSGSALAQWSVFDPTNWIQNSASARAAVRNEINTANAYIQQVKSAISLARSTAKLSNLPQLAGLQEGVFLYNQLKDVDSRLIDTLGRNQSLAENLVAQYGASGTSWEQFVSTKNSIAVDERKATLDRYESINSSLADTAKRRQEVVNQMSGVQGQTEALQSLGAALDIIIGQNQQVIMALKASSVTNDNHALDQQQDELKAQQMMRAYQKRLKDAAARY